MGEFDQLTRTYCLFCLLVVTMFHERKYTNRQKSFLSETFIQVGIYLLGGEQHGHVLKPKTAK